MINWKVRIRNRTFWMTFIPAVLLLIRSVAAVFGYALDFDALSAQLSAVAEAVFVLLSILGVVNDPTTAGLADSENAMTYRTPK